MDFPGGSSGKESACQCRRHKRLEFNPWVRKILWSRKWLPTPVFLLGKSHGLKKLLGYSLWHHKELAMTECTCIHKHTPMFVSRTVWHACSPLLCACVYFSLLMCLLNHVWLFAAPWTVTHQAPSSVEFPRQLEWVAISSSRRSSQSRDWTHIFCLHLLHRQADSLPVDPTRKPIIDDMSAIVSANFVVFLSKISLPFNVFVSKMKILHFSCLFNKAYISHT